MMKEQTYRVILKGTITEGSDRDRVVEKLAGAFKKDKRVIEKLLTAAPKSIRGGLDLATARKYKNILEKMGAVSYVESEAPLPVSAPGDEAKSTPPAAPVVPHPRQEPAESRKTELRDSPAEAAAPVVPESSEPDLHREQSTSCPKCGYIPATQDDVLLVRGDCPRCGLRVRSDLVIEEEESQEAEYRRRMRRPELIYRDRTPASWERKSAAALHTFALFLAVHACLVLLWIFLFVPVDALPTHAATLFLQAALLDWPGLLVSLAIVLVAFVLPLFNQGLSWGQRIVGIEVLYTEETKIGGLYMSLALQTAVPITVSLGPGWLVLGIASWMEWSVGVWTGVTVMFVGAILGWLTAWIYAYSRPDSRSLADLAAGTLQVEDAPMPRQVSRRAWLMILAVAAGWLLLAGVIPLVVRLIQAW